MYNDPMFVAAEIAYRKELFATGPGRATSGGRRHGHSWAERLSVRLHHRHTAQVRPA